MTEAELKEFIAFCEKYPGANYWDYVAYLQYSRQKWGEFIHGVFGL